MREAVILATAINAPQLIPEFEHRIERMTCADPDHALLRDLLLRHADDASEALKNRIAAAAGPEALENLYGLRHVAISPCLRKPGDIDLARMTLAEELAKLEARRGLYAEVAEAEEELTGMADEAVTWRLGQAAQARDRAMRSAGQENKAEYDVGENGARINRDERNAFDDLLSRISYSKSGR